MRRSLTLAAATLALAAAPGCSVLFGSVNRTFAEANKGFADVVLPEYRLYLDGDATLDADSKRIRKSSADEWDALIADALKPKEK